jgi:O-antigen ligase/Tfp pilus assembly protein PilF
VGSLRLLDRIVTALIIALVVLTPLALGSVYPRPAALIETAVALLIIIWAVRFARTASNRENAKVRRAFRFIAPAMLLGGLLIVQLIPLPSGVLRVISARTYEVYVRSLPGWPHAIPYSNQLFLVSSTSPHGAAGAVLPTLQEVRRGAIVPFANKTDLKSSAKDNAARAGDKLRKWNTVFPASWRPLAISPALTTSAVLRFGAYAGLFFVVFNYPFAGGEDDERRFYRLVLAAAIVAGAIVAAVGLAERAYWNGRILWLFVPMDWGAPFMGSFPRATGPFVNPDHFANYLTMIFPLALAGSFYDLYASSRRTAGAVRLLCAAGAVVILSAIVLSLSRAAWISASASTIVLSLLWAHDEWAKWGSLGRRYSRAKRSPSAARGVRFASSTPFASKASALGVCGIGLAALATVALVAMLMIGPGGRAQSSSRLAQTIADGGGLGLRPAVWKDSLRMARDFPLVGVGLGGWPEIFPHYQSGPWNEYYFREAHNDYLQYLTETGVTGLLALVWFLGLSITTFVRAPRRLRIGARPLFAALALALAAMALQESVDFCMHIPANALLFTLLLAIALRISSAPIENEPIATHSGRIPPRLTAAIAIAGGALFMLFALTRRGLPYPYDIAHASSLAQARALVIDHPASAAAHMELLSLAGPNLSFAMRLREFAAAVWLDPSNPSIRDRYAETLLRLGKEKDSLHEITRSVFNAPQAGTHYYLDKRLIPWLLPGEQRAVERGFLKAIAAKYPGAIAGLAGFYDDLGDFKDEEKVLAQAARKASAAGERASYLIDAAAASVRAGDKQSARTFFLRAIQSAPFSTDAYVELIAQVYGPAKDTLAAVSAAQKGIRSGADPARLCVALATAARISGDEALAENAYLEALRYHPSFNMIMRVAEFYLESDKAERATSMLRNAAEMNPASADAFYLLGEAEERQYLYSGADKAYARAAVLEPGRFRPAYAAFRRRMESSPSRG